MTRQLQRDVIQALRSDPLVGDQHIVVRVDGSVVTLAGQVSTYEAKASAVTSAEHVHGVKAVADELEVDSDKSHGGSDSVIATVAVRVLASNPALTNQKIQAEVDDGQVTLTGAVTTPHQREEAERVVFCIRGVTKVTNRVTVVPQVVAAEVEKRISKALSSQAALEAHEIQVTASEGKVILKGHVRSRDEDRIVREAARTSPGVIEVHDFLVVQP